MERTRLQKPKAPGLLRPVRWQTTERDHDILLWITRHGIVTHEQIARRFFGRNPQESGLPAAYRRIRKLAQLGLIERHPAVWHRGPVLVTVSKIGASIADIGLAPAPVALNSITMKHSLAVVDLTEDLPQQHPGCAITTERELRRNDRLERNTGVRRIRDARYPDALIHFPDGQTVAIELDLSHKTSDRHREKVQSFLRQPDLHVWWYCGTPQVLREVTHAVQTERADDRIQVRPWRH
jgi:hypothetical protein